MNDLYSEKDFQQLCDQLKKRYILLGVILAVLLAVFVYSFVIRLQWLSVVSFILFFAILVFFIEMFCLPLRRYRKLLASAIAGRTHPETLEYKSTEADTSVVDGVLCRGLIFLGEPDKHGARDQRFYWDAEHPVPAFRPGDRVTLKYTGHNIIGYQSHGDGSNASL